jgi:hypothetical protein
MLAAGRWMSRAVERARLACGRRPMGGGGIAVTFFVIRKADHHHASTVRQFNRPVGCLPNLSLCWGFDRKRSAINAVSSHTSLHDGHTMAKFLNTSATNYFLEEMIKRDVPKLFS